MTKFERIKRRIRDYQENADQQFALYKRQEAEARKKYSPEGFRQEFMQKTWVQRAGKAQSDASAAIRDINDIFEEIKEDFNTWVMKPLDNSTVQVLSCINDFNLNLSLPELQVIEGAVRDSYFGTKIFSGLASKNGYGVKVPEMHELLKVLDSAKSNAQLAVQAYAGNGPDYPGRDLIGKWEFNGVVQGEFTDWHLFYASNFLKDGGVLDELERMWGDSRAPMRYILTDSEAKKTKESLEKIIDTDGAVNREKAEELMKKEPDFENRLKSMPEGYLDHMEPVKKYFGLDGTDKQGSGESRISSAAVIAKEYIGSLGPVNMEALNQFK